MHRMVMEASFTSGAGDPLLGRYVCNSAVHVSTSHLQTAPSEGEGLAVGLAAAVPIRAHGVMPGIVLMLPLL